MIEQRFEFIGDRLYVYTSVLQYGGGVCESNLVMTKEIFRECYKKWIKPQESEASDAEYVKSLIDGKEPQYESRRTDEEIELGLDIGDEVVGDFGAKGVVVGIEDTCEDNVMLSLLMRNHKVPQLVKASRYKTKTGRHFDAIVEVLEQIKGEADGK